MRRIVKPPRPSLRLRVVCTRLPGRRFADPQDPAMPVKEPVYLGIQRGKEVIEEARADQLRVAFAPEFEVVPTPDGRPDFRGPYAQGPRGGRFFYLSWGVKPRGRPFTMFRRLKVGLSHLRWKDIERFLASGRPKVVTLKLTDAKGGPLCATPPANHVTWQKAAFKQITRSR